MVGGIGGLILLLLGLVLFGLVIAFVVVPLLKGIGWLITGLFRAIGWLAKHIYAFIAGMLGDAVRFIGAVIAWVVMVPLLLINIVVGRWSAAGHFWRSMNRECRVSMLCLYRVVLQHPLRFLMLDGLLEGLEERVGEAMVAAPASDKPSRRLGAFDGYQIVGSLPGGGSGARLYVAIPDERKRAAGKMPERVVIKSFAISDGSSLPQIVRESRALEAAKQLGLVLEHGMDEHRFHYVMPYHEGDHLGIVTRQLHGESPAKGLGRKQLAIALGYGADLVQTLARYHRGGLWHKDVKPDNVIIHDGRAHLVDLGLVTPLRSAMTLTTHGTEYFRDPEMVRMALRGVKVHQVDGGKFDVYAAGAVMYFVLENTFPAHGGLSAFTKESPESLRWIVRRAMADYNKRYESAEMMLADLEHVRQSRDPLTVKPAELPSMRGGAPADLLEEPVLVDAGRDDESAEVIASARTPKASAKPEPKDAKRDGPAVMAFGLAIGPGGVKAASFGTRPSSEQPAAPPARPNVRVTNWWTGAYEVEDAVEAETFQASARDFRAGVRDMRDRGDDLRGQVRARTISARKAAREQIKAARERARDIRRRASEHRARALKTTPAKPAEPAPTVAAATLAMLVLAVAGGVALINYARSNSQKAVAVRAEASQSYEDGGVLPPAIVEGYKANANPLTLLLINDHPAPSDPAVAEELARIVMQARDKGYVVVDGNREAEVEIRKWLPVGSTDEPSRLLEQKLQKFDLSGVLRLSSLPDENGRATHVEHRIIVPPSDSDTDDEQ